MQGMLAAGVAGGALSASGRASAATFSDRLDEYYDEFGTVIDVVEAGADNTGSESVTGLIRKYRDDDTLLVFPPGRYYMDEQVRFTGFEKFGLVGNGATLVPANYDDFQGPRYRLFRLGVDYRPGNRLVFEGFDIDQTAPDTGIRVIDAVVEDGLEVRDIKINGRHDSGTWGPARFVVSDPAGSGIVERFEAPDGGAWESETPNAGNIWRGPTGILANENKGTLTFKDCVLGGFPDNGLYAAGSTGKILVRGGDYANSNTASLRIGGTGSVVEGATVRIDENIPEFRSQGGLRLENSDDIRVLNTKISVTHAKAGCYPVNVKNTCGKVWMQDVDVLVESPDPVTAIYVRPKVGYFTLYKSSVTLNTPGGYAVWLEAGEGSGANLEYVTINGSAGDTGASSAIRNERDNSRFSNVTIDQPEGAKRYAFVNVADDAMLYQCEFRSNNYPVLDAGRDTWTEECVLHSYTSKAAYALHDDSSGVYLKHNTLYGGYDDFGCDGLRTLGNTIL
ncbi:MAG: right-handed parallel beta-helix repeat-containing protein [Haloarculaceae archaeon]